MAIKIMTMVFETKLGSATIKAVALKLADYANDAGGNIWPALDTVAEQTEVSKSSVQRSIKELLTRGILEVERDGGKGPGSTTRYRYNLTRLAAEPKVNKDSHPDHDGHLDHVAKVVTVTKKVVTDDGKGGQGDHRTVKEPPVTVSSSARAKSRTQPQTKKSSWLKEEKPMPLPEDWQIPHDWVLDAVGDHPERESLVHVEADKFAKFNRDRLTWATQAEWRELWDRWWSIALSKAPGSERARQIRDWNPGAVPRDTSKPWAEQMAEYRAKFPEMAKAAEEQAARMLAKRKETA